MTEREPAYGLLVARDVMVPMRDGVRLAADIYRPAVNGEAAPGRFPTILLRTSYDKGAQRYVSTIAEYFTPRGFVTVQQDLRGRYASEGRGQYRHTANPHEGLDGYDTIEWIAAQPWSNGRVGMVGSSHPGLVQTHAALYRPPHLTAIWPDVAPTDSYAHQVRYGGAMQLHMFGALFLHAQDSQEALADPALRAAIFAAMGRMRELVYATPFKPGHTPLAPVPGLEQTLFDYYTRGARDEFWSAECNDFARHFDRHADVPGTFTGGWFDPYASATTGQFAALAARSKSPQRLIMGPWTHQGMRVAGETYVANDVDFGPEAAWGFTRFNAEQLRWFDRWLRDEPTGVEDDPPVRIFVMGGGSGRRTAGGHLDHGGRWRSEREWPLARAVPTTFYLQPGGGLAPTPPPEDAPPAGFRYDPAHPVPTVGGPVTGFFEFVAPPGGLDPFWVRYLPPWTLMRSIIPDGPAHQRPGPETVGAAPPYLPLSMRPDVLVFQTAPLAEDIEVTGPVEVRLHVASSAPDTDFTAKLIDVYPPSPDYPEGYHMYLADGIIRCRYREGFEREALLEPGQVYAVTIGLPPTSNLFKAGHRIRLDISSSNFPRFDLNPNTGEPMGRHTHTQLADNLVFLDRGHPSLVVLPVVPA
ncbi:MAG TPA: CocE/NonD family hydrolase [Chloroflexaceae bacterium]|nr:CocE/NonD family hydrolase [Chloroflexaceae bacterium]